jgi:hypothetical protein
MSPCSVQPAWSSQRSVTKILPSTVPCTFTDLLLISPRMCACSPNRERSGGIDCALHLAVDEQLVFEFDRAFNRNSSGKKSAGLRWHERAVGWRWDDRWVWLIRLRGFGAPARRKAAKSVHGRALCRIIRDLGSGIHRNRDRRTSRLFEIARVLVRVDHIAIAVWRPKRHYQLNCADILRW